MTPNKTIIDIEKAIGEITNPNPDSKLFTNYRDFMKHRHIIPYYKFNQTFLNQILTLTENVWNSEKRINRAVLLETINSYLHGNKTKLDIQTKERLFSLIKSRDNPDIFGYTLYRQ